MEWVLVIKVDPVRKILCLSTIQLILWENHMVGHNIWPSSSSSIPLHWYPSIAPQWCYYPSDKDVLGAECAVVGSTMIVLPGETGTLLGNLPQTRYSHFGSRVIVWEFHSTKFIRLLRPRSSGDADQKLKEFLTLKFASIAGNKLQVPSMWFHLLQNTFDHITFNYELNLQVVCILWLNCKATPANQNHITWNRLRMWKKTISLQHWPHPLH